MTGNVYGPWALRHAVRSNVKEGADGLYRCLTEGYLLNITKLSRMPEEALPWRRKVSFLCRIGVSRCVTMSYANLEILRYLQPYPLSQNLRALS